MPTGRTAADVVDFLLDVGTQIHWTVMDCTHFVHYLYEMAGLSYDYAPSRILYRGIDGFTRVSKPQAGDLIVWEGHAGIVVDADQHTFLSVLRTGVKSSAYDSHYWQHRGHPRFFRHVALARAPRVQAAKLQIPKRIVVPADEPSDTIVQTSEHPLPGEAAIMGWMPSSTPQHPQRMAAKWGRSQRTSPKPTVPNAAAKEVIVGAFDAPATTSSSEGAAE